MSNHKPSRTNKYSSFKIFQNLENKNIISKLKNPNLISLFLTMVMGFFLNYSFGYGS